MAEPVAKCRRCGNMSFIIMEDKLVCPLCKEVYAFSFIAPGICETKANDIVILVNEGY